MTKQTSTTQDDPIVRIIDRTDAITEKELRADERAKILALIEKRKWDHAVTRNFLANKKYMQALDDISSQIEQMKG